MLTLHSLFQGKFHSLFSPNAFMHLFRNVLWTIQSTGDAILFPLKDSIMMIDEDNFEP